MKRPALRSSFVSRYAPVLAIVAGGVFAAVACGNQDSDLGAPDSLGAGGDGGDPFGEGGFGRTLQSLSIDPPAATIESLNGAPVQAKFKATAHWSNQTTSELTTNVAWRADAPQVGVIGGDGTYAANGSVGGLVTITAMSEGKSASATLTVKLHLVDDPNGVAATLGGALKAPSGADPGVVFAYPYDGTVWPRGLDAPRLMWNGGAPSDTYLVHVTSPTFELESYVTAPNAPAANVTFAGTTWQRFVDSTSGAATFEVARHDGAKATSIAKQSWRVAPASMRGTIYYWANNLGRIMRLKPHGGAAPEDFSASKLAAGDCTMTCHTVSADGSTLVAAGGTFGGSYDLKTNAPRYGLGGDPGSAQIQQWGLPAVSPKGEYVVVNAMATRITGGLAQTGMYNTSDGTPVTTSGLGAEQLFMPAFSPDGTNLVFVDGSSAGTDKFWASTSAPGALRVYDFDKTKNPMFSNVRDVVLPGSDPSNRVIAWPTVAPDGRTVVYGRLNYVDPSTQHNLTSFDPVVGDLYLADLKSPNSEVRLANLNGDTYPFAAGERDRHLSYEPSFAPVAAGGYYWVVFHSRRTYGNALTGDRAAVKQLWVAAIEQNPAPGKDPSYAAFWLPGQDAATLNLRAFWALDPCKNDGDGCGSGTECCGGYCAPGADGGAAVCAPRAAGCSQNGDRCDVATDCCNAASGVTCINHVCSEPTPH